MEWLQTVVRPEIWRLAAYSSARSEMQDYAGMIQLDANENPYQPYPLTSEVSRVNRYPDPQPSWLVHRLSVIYGANAAGLLIGRGMDEIIDVLIRMFSIPYQDKILITPPTYGMYQVAADIAGVEVVKLNLNPATGFAVVADEVIKLARSNQVKIIFLCTPNNPTGNLIPLATIAQIASQLPQTIIAVDEAYWEFTQQPSALTLGADHPNLVVMRTLSKAYAFAGVRIGSAMAHPAIIQVMKKVIAPYPLPEPCVRLAAQLLSPHGLELTERRIKLLISERERLTLELAKSPLVKKVYPSQANFILFEVTDAAAVYASLLARGIIARNRHKDVANCLRISIGTPAENDLLLTALGVASPAPSQEERCGIIVRNTNETKIMVEVNLDRKVPLTIKSGIGFFDHMLEQLAKHAGFSLQLAAIGDTHIDYHHTVEDVAIALGGALRMALGNKAGINRYGFVLPMDESCAFAAVDLSGRGALVYEAKFPTTQIGDFPLEMVEHFFLSFANNLSAAIHLKVSGENAHHMVEGLFKACARALGQALLQSGHELPSTKGVL